MEKKEWSTGAWKKQTQKGEVINFTKMIIGISGKNISINNIPGPTGVNGRNSDNTLIREKLGWSPSQPLKDGIEKTFNWIKEKIENKN